MTPYKRWVKNKGMPFYSTAKRTKPTWTRKFAWLPRKTNSGKVVWLTHYFTKSYTVIETRFQSNTKIEAVYTKNEYLAAILTDV